MTLPNALARFWAGLSIATGTTIAIAATPTFEITEVFSNLDGSVQFVQLTETAGLNGQRHFAGLTLTTTHDGITKTLTFPADLPSDTTAGTSIVVAATTGGLCVNYGGRSWCFAPEFAIPARFVPTVGGTIDFAGSDRVSYDKLPTDGWHALKRDGTIAVATLRPALPSQICQHAVPPGCDIERPLSTSPYARVVEYYNSERDHYFMSAAAADIDALDSGRIVGWRRTGSEFLAWTVPASAGDGLHPVCRFYIPPENGDSHFFSAFEEECAALRGNPNFVLESDAAFYMKLPDPTTGLCPGQAGLDPFDDDYLRVSVYRLWNRRGDSNHRYTTDIGVRDSMIERGYVPEGYGPAGVAFCL